jgi:hypothetical protein
MKSRLGMRILGFFGIVFYLSACNFPQPGTATPPSSSATPKAAAVVTRTGTLRPSTPAAAFTATPAANPEIAGIRGRLANPGAENRRILSALFFPGQARDGSARYECDAAPNLGLYTVHPADARHLEWSVSAENRAFALTEIAAAGLNTVAMSIWGEDFLPCSSGWAPSAPMQTASGSHDELFSAAVEAGLFIVPFIESRGDWSLRGEFPSAADGRIAPGAAGQIVNLIDRYLKNPDHPEWAQQWAQVYDRDGRPRYALALIHAASDRLKPTDDIAFAAGFDALSDEIFRATGTRVGFFLDPLPPATNAPGVFKPDPGRSGPFLEKTAAVLGIQAFIPEIWISGSASEVNRIAWKRDFSRRWSETGIPFLMDVSPGYDARIVFPGSVRYGFTTAWRDALAEMSVDFGADGLAFHSWNGYTEGMAAVPTLEYGDVVYLWLQGMTARIRWQT